MSGIELQVPYLIRNDGAGGAKLQPYQSIADAVTAEEEETEPFGETTARYLRLKLDGGKLFFKGYSQALRKEVWIPITGGITNEPVDGSCNDG